MHTTPTGNIPEAPELGTPHYKGQNVGVHYKEVQLYYIQISHTESKRIKS